MVDLAVRLNLQGIPGVQQGLAVATQAINLVGQSAADTARQLTGVHDQASLVRRVFETMAGIGSVTALVGIVKESISSAAALHDVAIQGQMTVESLSALASVGRLTNTGSDAIVGSLNRLTRNLTSTTEESKGTGKAIAALGIDLTTFKSLRPDEQMQTVAKAMDGFADGAGKSAVAMAIFGRDGAQMLPFLADLADAGQLSAKMTTEQADAAKAYETTLKKLSGTAEGWKKELAMGMLPALADTARAMLEMTSGTTGLRGEVKKLSSDGSLDSWTRTAVTGLSYVIDVGQGLLSIIPMIGKSLAGMAAAGGLAFGSIAEAYDKIKHNDFAGAWESLKSGARGVKTVAVEAANDVASIWNQKLVGQRFRETLDGLKNVAVEAKKTKPVLDATDIGLSDTGQSAGKAGAAYAELIARIKEKTAADTLELQYGSKLTEVQKMQLEIDKLVATGKIKLAEATSAKTQSALAEMHTAQEALAVHKAEIEWLTAGRDLRLKLADAQEKTAVEATKQNQTLKEEIALIGLSDAERVSVLQSRNTEIILIKEATLAEMDRQSAITGTMTREQIALAAEIEALKERNGLLGQKQVAEEASKMWTSVWSSIDSTAKDVFTSIFDGGNSSFKKLGQVLKTSVLDLLYQMTIKPFIVQIGTSLLGSGFASAATAATAQAAPSVAGSILGSAGTSVLGSFGTSLAGITATLGQFGTAALESTQSLIGLTGTAAQASVAATAGAAAQTGASTLASSLGTAVPYVAAAGAVAAALGLFRSTKTVGNGLRGTVGEDSSVTAYELRRKSGYLFGGPSYSVGDSALSSESATQITTAMDSIVTNSKAWASALGLSTEALTGFNAVLGSDLIHPDTGGIGIDLTGLTAEQAQAKIAAELGKAGDAFAQRLIGTMTEVTTSVDRTITEWVSQGGGEVASWVSRTESGTTTTSTYTPSEFAKAGETASATLSRLASSLVTVNSLWAATGQTLITASLKGADAASRLIDASGGADKLSANYSAFFDTYYKESEKTANTTRLVTDALANVNLTLPATRAAYRAQVEYHQAIVDTEPGAAAALAVLLAAAPAFASIVPEAAAAADAADTVTGAVGSVSEALSVTLADALESLRNPIRSVEDVARSLFDLGKTGQSLQVELMRAQGNTTGADTAQRTIDTAGYTAAEIAVYDYNAALRSQIDALTAAKQVEQDAANAAAAVASQRAGLEQQIMQAVGDTAGLRALELAALDPSNRALQQRLYALQDEAAATAAATAAQQQAEQAAAAVASQRAGLEQQLLQAQGDTASLRFLELLSLDPANRALQERIWSLQDEAAATATATAAATAAQQQAEQAAAAVASQRAGLEQQIMQAVGDTAGLRKLELSALDASNQPLQERLYALQDEAAATAAATAAQQQAEQAAAAVASQRAGLEQQIMQAVGDTAGLRALELAALDPSNRALQQRLYDLADEKSATEAANAAAASAADAQRQLADAAAAAAQAVASEHDSLWRQWLTTTGDTAALRALDLAAIDPANRALQEQIWAYEDAKKASEDAATAASTLASTWSSLTDSITAEVRRIRGLIDESSGSSYASLQASFAIATAQARAGDQTAAGQLTGLSQSLLTAAESSVSTLQDLQRIRALTAISLEQTASTMGSAPAPGAATVPGVQGNGASAVPASTATNVPATSAPASNPYADMTEALRAEIRALNDIVAGMRAEAMAHGVAVATNTGKISRFADKWDAVGLPVTNTPDAIALNTHAV